VLSTFPVPPALALFLSLVCAPAVAQTVTGKVVAVHDGDTISIRTATATIRVRLAGIDCPEYRQPYSARAKRFTSRLVFKKTVTVRGQGLDRFDRLLGRVIVDGVDVNESLVRNGLAWHYEIGSSDRVLAEAEKAARAARVGLWADANPIPPWRWRRANGLRTVP
jgi:endonuclease YncB( thermonuclease family)